MQHRSGWPAVATILLLSACSGEEGVADNGGSGEEKAPPIPVEVEYPTRGDIDAVYSGTAPIEAFAEADVIAKAAGEIRAILVEEGDEVTKGQVLARLDGDRLRLELNESEAKLRKLQRDFERNTELANKGLISEGDFEKIRFEMEALEASYNLARLELDYTQIRAPIDGIVSERFVKLGNTINVDDPVFRVTSFEPLVAYMHVPEREFRNIAVGQGVAISIDALDGPPVQATVTRVSPVVDPATGTFKTSIEIYDEARRIKPGMFGRISVVYDRHENALQVPRSAIVEELGESSVFVVEQDVAVRKPVRIGFINKGHVEILSGLAEDERVVTVGQIGLKPNARVTIIGEEAPESLNLANNSTDDDDATTD